MTEREVLDGAAARIEQHRKGDAVIQVVNAAGKPIAGATVTARQTRNECLFGCNIFRLDSISDPGESKAYRERFAHLLNYATLPFYWGGYEPEAGRTQERRLRSMADTCRELGIVTKGHPLVWHEVVPNWPAEDPDQIEEILHRRVSDIVRGFRGLVDVWDVVNEATVSANFDNPVGRWFKAKGAAYCVAKALAWADAANPGALLLYNDFNVSPAYENLLADLKASGQRLCAIGIQSHMHRGTWPIERVWNVCETYARFVHPLHFTEATVLSGPLKTDDDWHTRRDDWHSTPDGEAAQADYVERFYRTLFSHPRVEAITWWDFSDAGSWQGAPAGLVRKNMEPKPVYERLEKMILREWRTDFTGKADATGTAKFRGFGGTYQVEVTKGAAKAATTLTLRRKSQDTVTLTLR